MHDALQKVCASLDELGEAVLAEGDSDDPLTEALGWYAPAITRRGLSGMARRLSDRIRAVAPDDIDESLAKALPVIPKRLKLTQTETLPQMFGSNAGQAIPAYLATLEWVRQLLDPILTWQLLDDPSLVPPKMARRASSYAARLNRLEADMGGLEEKVKSINEAHDAATNLPTTMQELTDAKVEIGKILVEVKSANAEVWSNSKEAEGFVSVMRSKADEATKLIDQCEEAYRVTTSKGLAGAFDERAASLRASMRYWVIALALALMAGGWVGKTRIDALSALFSSDVLHWETVFAQLLLTVLGIGGPLWFAWVATKQIGHRFRLAEDYAFKASVSKAYEGYRREAANIDPVFEARLFSSALVRFEEAPLRLVEDTTHGSPWHEFMTSPVFQEAAATVPNFKETLIAILKRGAEAVKRKQPEEAPPKKTVNKEEEETV